MLTALFQALCPALMEWC